MEEFKYKLVENNSNYKELGVFNKLNDLEYKLFLFGDDKRRLGRTSQDNFNDCIIRFTKTTK
jgi:hypothetical protein